MTKKPKNKYGDTAKSKKARQKRSKKAKEKAMSDVSQLPADLAKKLSIYTPKQAAFYFWYSVMGNQTRAALKVYYPDFPIDKKYEDLSERELVQYSTAASMASENLKKHENPVSLYLEQNGLDFSLLAQKLKEGLEATHLSNAALLLTKDGETIKAEEQGVIEVPDYEERREWWDRFARMLGVSIKEQPKVSATAQQQVNIFNRLKDEEDEFVE